MTLANLFNRKTKFEIITGELRAIQRVYEVIYGLSIKKIQGSSQKKVKVQEDLTTIIIYHIFHVFSQLYNA